MYEYLNGKPTDKNGIRSSKLIDKHRENWLVYKKTDKLETFLKFLLISTGFVNPAGFH